MPTPNSFFAWLATRAANADECWVHPGAPSHRYAMVKHRGQRRLAHRLAYELLVGPIPDGMQIDHLCKVIRCVNPAHLEAVTPRENVSRSGAISTLNRAKTHCIYGHPFNSENTMVVRHKFGPMRVCRTCDRRRKREFRARQRLKHSAA